uniref:Uncharacterized protein n=1 Tax=Anopheles minimus TaxID=112268 RepID=A0A182VS71_9DIPT
MVIWCHLRRPLADRQEDVVQYVNRLVQDEQRDLHVGVFTCWLLQFTNSSSFATLQSGLASRISAHYIGLLQMNHQGKYVPASQEPNMALILLGSEIITHSDYNPITQWLPHLPIECKTIVLFERTSDTEQVLHIGQYLAMMGVWNVVLIATNIDALYVFHYGPVRVLNYTGYPESSVLFFDRLQSLETRNLNAAYTKDIRLVTPCQNTPAEDFRLFKLFADTVNLQLYTEEMQCHRNESPVLCGSSLVGLALFGFEKRLLRFTARSEIVTASALIAMFFLLKCAYEAKLISFITKTPRYPGALSVQELRERNITVYHKNFNTTHMNKLEGMLDVYDGDAIAFEGLTILDNIMVLNIEMLVNDVEDFDETPYNILEEIVFEALPFYSFQPKSPIRKPFLNYHLRVFEAGLPLHWEQETYGCYIAHANNLKLKRPRKPKENFIHEDKLKPLVLFFSVQWVLAVAVFVAENLFI